MVLFAAMRRAFLPALLAACACPGKAVKEQPATPAAVVQPPAAGAVTAKPPQPARPTATSDPDVPTGAAAARDAELAKVAEGIVTAFSNVFGVFTRDGKRVVFISDRDGLPQVYVADAGKPDGPATRLVTTTERVGQGMMLTKDGKSLLFMSDHGADELWDIFKVDLDGKNLQQLSSGEPLNRDGILYRDGAPDRVFYSARKMSEPASTLYSLPLQAGAPPNKHYADPGVGFLGDVTTDGKWGAWIRVPSRSENSVHLVELATGKDKLVYPPSGKVTIHDTTFSYDGKLLYVSTDGGGEQALLLAFDVKTLKEVARYLETKPATATLAEGRAAKKGNVLAVAVHAGNRIELRLLDGRTLKPKAEVKVPLGLGFLGDFSEDGKKLSVSWSTPDAPTELYSVDVKTGAMTPLRKDPRPTLAGLGGVETTIETIKSHDGLDIPINVYLPGGTMAAGKKRPVIVEYHGGPAAASVVRWSPMARMMLSQGYAYVQPNVRGSGGFGRAFEEADNREKRAEAFKDVELAGRWAASQPWADKDRLVVMGGSYGGYTVLIALTRMAPIWRAGVDLVGVVNMRTFLASTSGVIREIFKLEFGDLEKDAALLDAFSPIRDVDKIVDPLFVYQGANDPRVPKAESDQVVKALRERGIPVEYMLATNEGHSYARRETQIALFSRICRFLETVLAK